MNAPALHLGRVESFVAAAEESAFRRAARRKGVGLPGFSRQIAALENELGVELFERRSTGVRLTEVGRNFLVEARRIVAAVDRARHSVETVACGTSGRLRLGLCEDATTPILAEIVSAYRERFPAIAFELFEMPSAAQTSALRRGEIDAGLLLPPVHDDGVQIDEVWREPWAIAIPLGHALAAAESITIADVAQFGIIASRPEPDRECCDEARRLFASAGIEPRIVMQTLHRQTMLMLVQSGAGITIVPGSFIGTAMAGIEFRPLLTDGVEKVVSAAFPEGDMPGLIAQFLRVATMVTAASKAG